ncbi:MAG: hypothetical protein FWG06_02800, partial [Clostridiales bacterium]|nr:hypothetical protein [Clostridiales bacterium]
MKTKKSKSSFNVKLRSVLAACLTLLLTLAAGSLPVLVSADGEPVGDVIFNYPYNGLEPPTTVENIFWNYRVDHNSGLFGGYEQAYTEERSFDENDGEATPDHVVPKDSRLSFYGYGIRSYMDYVFTEGDYQDIRGASFIMRPSDMWFHTFSETGFLFNGTMGKDTAGNTCYTGYALILSCGNTAGMQEHDENAPNTAALRLFYMENELWNTENFRPGSVATTRTLIATFKTGINDHDSTPYRVSVEIDPASRAFKIYLDGGMVANIPVVAGGGDGLGFYTGYYSHNCDILTIIRYEDMVLSLELLPETPQKAVVNFFDENGVPIREPETAEGIYKQPYRIEQPKKITVGEETYWLSSNSVTGSSLNDIRLQYNKDNEDNITDLYYKSRSVLVNDAESLPPEKHARVGGSWQDGTESDPVVVTAGSEIEYSIMVYDAPERVAMVRLDWINDPISGTPVISRGAVKTITFVDLQENLEYPAQLGDDWAGKTIKAAWDVTEDDDNINP